MPESTLSSNNQHISLKLKVSVKCVAEKSLSMAPSKLHGAADTANTCVSVDEHGSVKA